MTVKVIISIVLSAFIVGGAVWLYIRKKNRR